MGPTPYPVLPAPREYGAATLNVFQALLAPHLESARALVVDLEEVTLITSSALGQLVHVGQRLRQRGALLVLARGRRRVVRVFETVGLESVMPLFATLEEAFDFLGARVAGDAQPAG
jgi:anti-anti-sigma factor